MILKALDCLSCKRVFFATTINVFLVLSTSSQLKTRVESPLDLFIQRQGPAPLVLSGPLALSEQPLKYETPPRDQTNLYLAGGIALTALLYQYDQQSYDALYSWKQSNALVRKVSPIITELGNGVTSLALFGGATGYGMIVKDEKALNVGKLGLESFFVSGIVVQLLKHTFGRERPNVATKRGGAWHGPVAYFRQGSDRPKGFSHFDAIPSGHVATVFAAAATLADASEKPWVGYTSYSVAALVAISRVTEQTHWMSDNVLGGLIGVLSAHLVRDWNLDTSGISVHPLYQSDKSGVVLAIKL
jgi:membrane-associated phospholipid phosphatase